jgi:hypothetical protein
MNVPWPFANDVDLKAANTRAAARAGESRVGYGIGCPYGWALAASGLGPDDGLVQGQLFSPEAFVRLSAVGGSINRYRVPVF